MWLEGRLVNEKGENDIQKYLLIHIKLKVKHQSNFEITVGLEYRTRSEFKW